ncbi:MAG: histidine--tRNA ligase [Ignavibacteria bacterium]|nr:histidine--tRNA ligase [Ignavibacteria bacterium]
MSEQQRGIMPQKIKGFRDINPEINRLRWHIIEKASRVYRNYGFEHWDTPIVEYADSLGKYLPDADSVAEGVYSFRNPEKEPIFNASGNRMTDGAGNFLMENHFLTMRYDLTAPLSRVYAEKIWSPSLINQKDNFKAPLFRRFQYGPVFRFEAKLDPGRFREFWQLDFDTVGSADAASDAEVCMVLSDALEAIGIQRATYRVKVNNRKVLKGVLIGCGIADEKLEQDVLRIIDKADKIGQEGVMLELGKGRKDASGAIIEGLNLNSSTIDAIARFLEGFSETPSRSQLLAHLSNTYTANAIFDEGLKELAEIDAMLNKLGYAENRVIFDPALVRGMAYYTGPVFEVESLSTFIDEKGRERRVGAICGGGRYDGLVERLIGVRVPATGASIGVDRLGELLTLTNALKLQYTGPVLVVVFDPTLMTEYQMIAAELRAHDIPTEIYYGMQKGLKKQLSYADESKSPVAILLGGDELEKGVVTVRNLRLGAQMSGNIVDKNEWKQMAQKEVARGQLVTHVKEILTQKD